MEVSIKNISFQTGKYQSGRRTGEDYEVFVLTLGHASMFSLDRGFTVPIFKSQSSHGELFELLSEMEKIEDEKTGEVRVDMKAFREYCKNENPELLFMGTNLYDKKTGAPFHNCARFVAKRMQIGENDANGNPTKWMRYRNGEPITRTTPTGEEPIIETHYVVHWMEFYDAFEKTWKPFGDITSEDAAMLALEEDRRRLFRPIAETVTSMIGNLDEAEETTTAQVEEDDTPAAE